MLPPLVPTRLNTSSNLRRYWMKMRQRNWQAGGVLCRFLYARMSMRGMSGRAGSCRALLQEPLRLRCQHWAIIFDAADLCLPCQSVTQQEPCWQAAKAADGPSFALQRSPARALAAQRQPQNSCRSPSGCCFQ